MKRLLVAMADLLQNSSSISAYELKTSGLGDDLLVFLTFQAPGTPANAAADLKVCHNRLGYMIHFFKKTGFNSLRVVVYCNGCLGACGVGSV